jgi:NAD(P)-dependent dehydrogenase (short-subunit alcohol dehydrogenase family)
VKRLAGRVALITGGGDGIGRAAALAFTREGAKVVIADINATLGQETGKAIGDNAFFVETDVTREESLRATVEAAVERFGKLDTLFNCAGGSVPADKPVTELDLSVFEHTIGLDLKGTMLACKYAIPRIVAAGGGTVINMSSGAALRGANPAHVYTAAKGAIVSLTRSMAGIYAKDNVRVNCICAGRIDTPRVRRTYGLPGRPGGVADPQDATGQLKSYPFWVGKAEDIANIALFLASDESRMITGAAIAADGGRSAY